MKNFKEIDLPSKLYQTLESMGFHTPTPIQAKAIPLVLKGSDIMGCAQTGTGKTAAFCIPMIAHLLKAPAESALILAPTRELALQIKEVLLEMTAGFTKLKPTLLVGGASMYNQVRALSRRPQIFIGTPGRVMDHLNRRTLRVDATKIVVLDEADRMLDMGFEPQLREIFRYLPKTRQTLLFSATFPNHIKNLTKKYLTNPKDVSVGQAQQPIEIIKQTAIQTSEGAKNKILLEELDKREGSVLIFTRTKRRTDRLLLILKDRKFKVGRLHGGLSQSQRNRSMEDFRRNRYRILVATDVAARGLDVDHIKHVINYDLPSVPEDYVHRIGRTARAGAQGEALSLLVPSDYHVWRKISLTYKIKGNVLGEAPKFSGSQNGGPRNYKRQNRFRGRSKSRRSFSSRPR
jgi:ATP-dependent RNA helicase DeaD